MKNLKTLTCLLIVLLFVAYIPKITLATETNIITINNTQVSENATIPGVKITNKMNNGTEKENKEIDTIINITEAGTYEISGTLENGQISINANNISGEVKIILNNCNITCSLAPAIFVYSQNTENENCKVTIEIAPNTQNIIKGSKIKTSVEGWDNQDKVEYYIEKGTDDEGKYYERYKYDGAISSDISLTFEGEGTLNVEGLDKEGIETKRDLTFNSGNIIVNSQDDAINACTDGKSKIEINGGLIVANISPDAEEGDGIDSNGTLYINGGKVYAFACPGSDNGLDSDGGTYINGGEVISTGSMYEEVRTSNKTKIIQMQLSKRLSKDTNIAIVDSQKNVVYAFKTDREISCLAVSTEELKEDEEYSVYSNVEITGNTNEYGVYETISDYDLDKATLEENSNKIGMDHRTDRANESMATAIETDKEKDYKKIAIPLIVIGVTIAFIIIILDIKSKKTFTILNLIIGIVIGIILTCGMFFLLNPKAEKEQETEIQRNEPQFEQNRPQFDGKNQSSEMDRNF